MNRQPESHPYHTACLGGRPRSVRAESPAPQAAEEGEGVGQGDGEQQHEQRTRAVSACGGIGPIYNYPGIKIRLPILYFGVINGTKYNYIYRFFFSSTSRPITTLYHPISAKVLQSKHCLSYRLSLLAIKELMC
jgi:hypothetical protein